ncbi:uncharacterized protein LOC18431956 [Amborella trichopoda]|uniref:Uncharacterized protein n=1 Tax=Amborella trichopoda TaxID=13333 RepID=W1P9Y7_AMBTC|nr:uncharacterized protein LOC18431956 [Amborella trichopoda]ERN03805.1 hypothetical protein AMTR_s00078p00113510 [Amborella trichopoda]|eukprot:XP_006842130.1 uncharacterized protein LOC18431956 [Amborella trichopoda]
MDSGPWLSDEPGTKYAQINAFSDRPFGGNPAAVCYLTEKKSDKWMQLVAREFNLSETAFLLKIPDVAANNEFSLRWFTPKVEYDLCGHATLASAHFLFTYGFVDTEIIKFHTKSGILTAKKARDGAGSPDMIELDFPVVPLLECDAEDVEKLKSALGDVEMVWSGKPMSGGYVVELSSNEEVKRLQPRFDKMLDFHGNGGLTVTAAGGHDNKLDMTSRFFCPKAGVLEDPVTGSAHCALAPYWESKLQKNILNAFQASERGGNLCLVYDKVENRVKLLGHSVTIMKGILLDHGAY